jgi:metal-responsive CopG/Arc/MetJ family transcriptional regulator
MVDYVNIPIPKPLYNRLDKSLEGSGYRSTTEYIIFLIRKKLPDLESEDMEKRLKALGYIS